MPPSPAASPPRPVTAAATRTLARQAAGPVRPAAGAAPAPSASAGAGHGAGGAEGGDAGAVYDEVLRRVVGHLRAHETLTVAEARDLLQTTRKYMLAIFEHLDERRITRRVGDDRVLGPNAPALAAVPEGDGPAARG